MPDSVEEPFPIFKLAHRYILYDVNTITYIRAKYNIIGVLIGSLPQAPQQNVFQGIPLELMPEEARLLCEKGVAYILDDVKRHKNAFLGNGLGEEEKRVYKESLRRQGTAAAGQAVKKAEDRKKAALGRIAAENSMQNGGSEQWNDIPVEMLSGPSSTTGAKKKKRDRTVVGSAPGSGASTPGSGSLTPALRPQEDGLQEEESLFGDGRPPTSLSRTATNASTAKGTEPLAVTPTTSYPPLTSAPSPTSLHHTTEGNLNLDTTGSPSSSEVLDTEPLPDVPPSYPLYKHMHEKDFFLAPGLRFGCQYMAYPGDPLRFHSHFLCNGMDWEKEFDLLDIVGGGRLGTGVKKGFLIGGKVAVKPAPGVEDLTPALVQMSVYDGDSDASADGRKVRTFCVEWGGM